MVQTAGCAGWTALNWWGLHFSPKTWVTWPTYAITWPHLKFRPIFFWNSSEYGLHGDPYERSNHTTRFRSPLGACTEGMERLREPSRSKAQKEGSSRGGGGSSARDTGVLRTVHWHEPRMPDIRGPTRRQRVPSSRTWKSRLDGDYDSYVNHQRHRIQALALAPLVLPKAGAAPLVLPKAGAAPLVLPKAGAAPLVLPKAARKTRPSRGGPNSKLQTGATGPKHRLKTRAALKSPNLEVLNRKASQSKKKGVPQKAAWRGSNFCFKRKQRKAKTNGWNLKMRVFLKGISFFQGSIFSQVGTGSFLQGVISSRHFTAPHTDQMW